MTIFILDKYKDQVVSTVDSLTPAKSVGGPGGPMGGQPVTEIPQEIMNQENPGQSMESPNFETPPQPQSEQISKPGNKLWLKSIIISSES